MQIEDCPITEVRPYPNNPRVLRNAAEKVAEQGVIIIGHSRLAAAKLLKLTAVPVHVASGLSDAQVRALRVADNKTAEFSAWDDQKLADELAEIMAGLGEVAVTGFTRAEFDAIEMQALAALESIAVPSPVPLPSTPAAPVSGPVGQGTPEPEEEAGEDEALPVPAPQPASGPDLVPFNCLMKVGDRQALYDAINSAKARHGLDTTAEALAAIARSYTDAA